MNDRGRRCTRRAGGELARGSSRATDLARRDSQLRFLAGTAALLPFDLRLTRALQVVSIHQHVRIAVIDSAFRLTAVPGALSIGTTMYAVGCLTHVARAASLAPDGTRSAAADRPVIARAPDAARRVARRGRCR